MKRERVGKLVGFLGMLLLGGVERLPAEERAGDGSLEELIEVLRSENFSDRKEAIKLLGAQLTEEGEAVADRLLDAYVRFDDPELHFQIRNLLFRWRIHEEGAGIRPGFVGISMMRSIVRLPAGERLGAIIVAQVLPETGAARAGLKVGDVILSINGQTFPPQDPGTFFLEEIGGRLVETSVKLDLVSPQGVLDLGLLDQAEPQELNRLLLAVIDSVSRVPREEWRTVEITLGERPQDNPMPPDLLSRSRMPLLKQAQELFQEWFQAELAERRKE
ncbi:MAG: PDZ domain-containing protein [Verrucomicrobiota bacterium]